MATGTAQQIIAVKSPSFAADPRLADFVTLAAFHVTAAAFGDRYQYALALVVLHWLTLDAQHGGSATVSAGGGGAVVSEREGDLQRSYSVPDASSRESYYSTSIYGQEFLALRRGAFFCPSSRLTLGVSRG